MMNYKNLFLGLFVVCVVPSAAFAAPIEAEIVRLDRDSSMLILSPIDPQSKGREVKVTLQEVKEYWGVNSLKDLEKGRVIVNVEDSSPDVWSVKTLELMKTRIEGDKTVYVSEVTTTQVPGKTYEVMIEHDMPHDAGNPKYVNLGRRGTETITVQEPSKTIVQETVTEVPQTGASTTTTTTTTQES